MKTLHSITVLVLALGVCPLGAQPFQINWSTHEGGGGTSSGGGLALGSTIGQPAVGAVSGGGLTLRSGFQTGLLSADDPCPSGTNAGEFIIDAALSTVTVSGHLVGYPLQPQGASSLVASYQGSIRAVVTSNRVAFTGGSVIDAQVSGTWRPLPGGGDGAAPADYGGTAVGPLGVVTINAAMRNFVLDVTSACVPLANRQFPATALTFHPASSTPPTLDAEVRPVDTFPIPFSAPFTSPLPNQAAATATLQTAGSVETVTLPFNASTALSLLNPNDSLLTFNGTLVARRTNPPPVLTIHHGSSQTVILRWPHPSTGYVLEQSADLGGPGGWTEVAIPPLVVGTNREVTVPAAGASRFYRLRPQ